MILLALAACAHKAPPQNTDDSGGLAALYTLPDDDRYPESATFDPQDRVFYSGSLGRGDVLRTSADGASAVFFPQPTDRPWLTIGLELDPARRWLWVCASVFDGSAPGELWALDLGSGERVLTVGLGAANPAASCTDVNIGPDGLAYVTDRANANLYRADPATGAAEVWVSDPLLEPDLVGLNGVVFTPDGSAALVTMYRPPALIRVPLDQPEALTEVAVEGESLHTGTLLGGADDLVVVGEVVYVTLVGRVLRLESSDGWASAQAERVVDDLEGVTGLAVAEGALYGSNGQAVQYSLGFTPETPFTLARLLEL